MILHYAIIAKLSGDLLLDYLQISTHKNAKVTTINTPMILMTRVYFTFLIQASVLCKSVLHASN